MSETEMTPQVPEAAPTPEASVTETPVTPGIDLNAKVEFQGKEVPVSELMSAYGKVSELETYKQAASAVMKGDQIPTQDRESAMRYLLHQEGYTPSQIEDYISDANEVYTAPEETQQPMTQEENQAPPPVDSQAREQLDALQQQNNQMMVDMLKNNLSSAMEKTMSQNDKIQMLIKKSEQLNGSEDIGTRVSSIRDEVQRMALENMRQRRTRGEKFDKAWFDEETSKAADTVYQRIRSVIGDPDKIQRAPETASSAEQFINKPPVADPKFAAGDNMGTVTDKSHDYTVDVLSRLSADLSLGGENKI